MVQNSGKNHPYIWFQNNLFVRTLGRWEVIAINTVSVPACNKQNTKWIMWLPFGTLN